MNRKPIFPVMLCCLLAACEIPLGSDNSELDTGNYALQTDRPQYEATIEQGGRAISIAIKATFHNTTTGPVYFTGCRPPHTSSIEKQAGENWVLVYAPIVNLCLGPPVMVVPGAKIDIPSDIYACFPGENCGPTFDSSLNGTFRLRQYIYLDPEGTVPAPEELRVSNAFEITGWH